MTRGFCDLPEKDHMTRLKPAAAALEGKYRTQLSPVSIGRARLELFELTEDDPIVAEALDRGEEGEVDLPFWTKLWPASLLLGRFVAGLEPRPDQIVLELGAGLGLVGLVAAAHGHRVIVSDIDVRALELARASAAHNALDNVSFVAFDWSRPGLRGTFEVIVAGEILYRPADYPLLADLLSTHLAPDGHLYLAHTQRPFFIGFFDLIKDEFSIRRRKFNLRTPDEADESVFLYDIRPRTGKRARP
ncbi:MAG: methyltransferase domain-containing protein [Proteobacteria bacterium]|nr:methyltransferase domain-containing protein [Pseudomonadota bacterium]MBU1741239.1 methyltransferase domain-containing protein [Pseudomonadota bacterium]